VTGALTLTNSQLGVLLAEAASRAEGQLARALRRASRKSITWPEEAHILHFEGRSLTELDGIGPRLARMVEGLLNHPPPEVNPVNRHPFLTYSQVAETLSANPDWLSMLRGDLQMHSTYSDGYASLEELAEAASERGYEYIAITDHSKALKIANGMDEERLMQQMGHIDRINENLAKGGRRLRLLRSIEMNLDPEGRGDMEPEVIGSLDLVLGSFHSKLRVKTDQTERLLAGIGNPQVHILGHPQGRMFNSRPGLVADWDRVFATAALLDKAVEIDAFPDRQDLDVVLLERAADHSVRISIGSDSHHPSQLWYIEFGLAAAIRAGVSPARILNFMSREELLSWSAELKARARAPVEPAL
jgi:histidinol phosphatase-like PHP family hydrolase